MIPVRYTLFGNNYLKASRNKYARDVCLLATQKVVSLQ